MSERLGAGIAGWLNDARAKAWLREPVVGDTQRHEGGNRLGDIRGVVDSIVYQREDDRTVAEVADTRQVNRTMREGMITGSENHARHEHGR